MGKQLDKKLRWIFLFSVLMILALTAGCDDDGKVVYRDRETVEIGGIVALSDASPIWGSSCLEALLLAEADMNKSLTDRNSNKRVRLIFGDSETDPVVADALLQSFINMGARAVIGPLTSSELLNMEDTINTSESIIISPSSTLSLLSVPDDNIFRMVPDDHLMVDAIVKAMQFKGIRQLVVMYIDDAWGTALLDELSLSFEQIGGTILGSRNYLNKRTDILQTNLADLSQLVSDRMASDAGSSIGFLLICYDEGLGIVEIAAADPVLAEIPWFGTDGFVKSRSLLQNKTAANFLVQTDYLAPALEVPLTPEGERIKVEIETATGGLPATYYSLLAYDAFLTAATVLVNSPGDIPIDDLKDGIFSEFKNAQQATGTIDLNDTGDQAEGTYYFWTITAQGDSYTWKHELTFESRYGTPVIY